MKIKILVDSISLLSTLTGIGRYTNEVSKHLKINSNFDTSFFYGYHSKNLISKSNKSNVKNLKTLIVKNKLLKNIAREVSNMVSKLFSPTYDIYWQPNFIPNLSIKSKYTVTSVHDFSFIIHDNFHTKEKIEYFQDKFFQNIYKSDMIITGSNFTKQEILDRLDFTSEKVKVVYHGIDHDLFKIYNDTSVSFELPLKFIFIVGSIEPRKNLIGLLKAYDSIDKELKNEYKLVLAGFKGWENKEVMELINSNKEDIHYLGYISDIELAKTYNLASLFVYPSFYEGFGLPPLESMACGTPVICSNTTSLPEVGGDAVVYCDPYDVENIKVQIELVLNDEILQKDMIKNGLERVKQFTWEKSANKHIQVFKELINGKE